MYQKQNKILYMKEMMKEICVRINFHVFWSENEKGNKDTQ